MTQIQQNQEQDISYTDISLLGLDPLFWIYFKCFIRDILCLGRHASLSDLYFYKERPVRQVQISGIIMGKDEVSKYVNYVGEVFNK